MIQIEFIQEEKELIFLNLLFTKHPKSNESWSHR